MISAVCSIAVESVTTTWRSGQPNGPNSSTSRGSRRFVTSSARAQLAAPARPAAPRRSPRRRPPSRSASAGVPPRTSSRGRCWTSRRAVGLEHARAPRSGRGRRRRADAPLRRRVGPRLARAEPAVEPPAPALAVRDRGDRVGEQRHAPCRRGRSGRAGGAARGCRRRRRRCRARRARSARRASTRTRGAAAARRVAEHAARGVRDHDRSAAVRQPRAPLPHSRTKTPPSGSPGRGS